jgi:hypothetical protein
MVKTALIKETLEQYQIRGNHRTRLNIGGCPIGPGEISLDFQTFPVHGVRETIIFLTNVKARRTTLQYTGPPKQALRNTTELLLMETIIESWLQLDQGRTDQNIHAGSYRGLTPNSKILARYICGSPDKAELAPL